MVRAKSLRREPLEINYGKVESIRTLIVKAWKSKPGLNVAAMQVRGHNRSAKNSKKETTSTVYVAVFKGGTARKPISIVANATLQVGPDQTLTTLDVEPYAVAPERSVLGVRLEDKAVYADGEGRNTWVSLLVFDGGSLTPVWSTLLSSSMVKPSPSVGKPEVRQGERQPGLRDGWNEYGRDRAALAKGNWRMLVGEGDGLGGGREPDGLRRPSRLR